MLENDSHGNVIVEHNYRNFSLSLLATITLFVPKL